MRTLVVPLGVPRSPTKPQLSRPVRVVRVRARHWGKAPAKMSTMGDRQNPNLGGDFVEALARGLEVIKSFGPTAMELTVSEVAARTNLARPTARRLLLTLEALGYVRVRGNAYSLTTRVLELGTAYIAALGLWEVAEPHMAQLVAHTRESTSMAQLDGSDIVYVARVAVPKIIALSVQIGTRFPAVATSLGRVLLSGLTRSELDAALACPSLSGIVPRIAPTRRALDRTLAQVREQGWALSDEQLAIGVRSIAVPVLAADGSIVAAMNISTHAAETSVETLVEDYLPRLLETAAAVSRSLADQALLPRASISPIR